MRSIAFRTNIAPHRPCQCRHGAPADADARPLAIGPESALRSARGTAGIDEVSPGASGSTSRGAMQAKSHGSPDALAARAGPGKSASVAAGRCTVQDSLNGSKGPSLWRSGADRDPGRPRLPARPTLRRAVCGSRDSARRRCRLPSWCGALPCADASSPGSLRGGWASLQKPTRQHRSRLRDLKAAATTSRPSASAVLALSWPMRQGLSCTFIRLVTTPFP